MATQDFTISFHPHAAENAAFTLVEKKNNAKSQKELAHLSSLLVLLEEEMAQAKSGKAEKEPGKLVDLKTGVSPKKSFEESMAEMALALQLLQVKIAQTSNEKGKMDREIAEAQVKLAQNNLEKVEKAIKKMVEKAKKEKTAEFWEKFAAVFIAAVLDVVAVLTLNPATAAILIAISTTMLVLTLSGIMKKAVDAIATGLEADNPHMSPLEAHIIAAVIVTVVMIALSLLAPGAEVDAVEEGAEEVVDATANVAEEGAEGTTSALKSALRLLKSAASKTGSGFKALSKPFKMLHPKVNYAIMALSQGLTQTGLAEDIAGAIASAMYKNDKQAQQTAKEIIEVVLMVLATLTSVGSGTAVMEGASAGSSSVELEEGVGEVSKGRQLLKGMREFARSANGLKTFAALQVAGAAGESTAGIFRGVYEISQGELEKVLADLNANLQLIHTAEGMSSAQMKSDQKAEGDALKSQKTGDESISKLMAGEAAFANVLTQNSPV